MATLKIRMVIGLIALFVGGMSLDAVAQKSTNMPAQVQKSCSLQRAGQPVNLTVAGQLPSNAKVQAMPVQRTTVQGKQVRGAYDITIKNGNAKWQPQAGQPVTVTITDPNFTDGEFLDVYHEDASGSNEFVATVSPVNHTISFPAQSFSIYEVVDVKILTVNFYDHNGILVNTQYIRQVDGQVQDLYNPTFNMEYGESFYGWANNASATSGSNITDLNTTIENNWNTYSANQTLNFYAVVKKVYVVTYNKYDENDALVVLLTEKIATDLPPANRHITIINSVIDGQDYMPTGQTFDGWYGKDGQTYDEGDDFLVESHFAFYLKENSRKWLIFDANAGGPGSGATYTPPQMISNNTHTQQPTEPTRPGYHFLGWNTSANGTGQWWGPRHTYDADDHMTTSAGDVEFGHDIDNDVTLYAQWQGALTQYAVLFWKQSASDPDSYVFVESEIRHARTGETVTITSADQSKGGTADSEYGYYFTYSETASNPTSATVAGNGTTVLNVRYNRREITYNFNYGNSDYTLQENQTSFTGLYGSPFTEWPNPGNDSVWSYGGYNFPLALTVFDPIAAYNGDNPNSFTETTITFTRKSYSSAHTLTIYHQDSSGVWIYDNDHILSTALLSNSGNWYPTETFTGYTIQGYQVDNSVNLNGNWTPITSTGKIDYDNNVFLRYACNQHNLNFISQGENTTGMQQTQVTDIYYGAGLSSYANTTIDNGADGYAFVGWYKDQEGFVPFNFNDEIMGDEDITVYAKWEAQRCRVVLDPNAPDGEYSFANNQSLSFRLDYNEAISDVNITGSNAVRPGYQLDGWYTVDGDNLWNFITQVNGNVQGVNTNYQSTDDWNNNTYGDNDGAHDNVKNILKLYAKWVLDVKQNSAYILYKVGDAYLVYNTNGTLHTQIPTDNSAYTIQDNSISFHLQGAPVDYNSNYHFNDWALLNADGTKSAHQYQANELATISNQYFKAETITDDNGQSATIYYVIFEAEFTPVADHATVVNYKGNGGTTTSGSNTFEQSILVNNTFTIAPDNTFSRSGYTFKEWNTEADGSGIAFTAGTAVAADNLSGNAWDAGENQNILYAIWEPAVEFEFDPICQGQTMTLPTANTAGVEVNGTWTAASAGTISGTTYTAPDAAGTAALTFTPAGTTEGVSFNVTVLANPTIAIETTRESCKGEDGSVKVTATGGMAPYSYKWTDGTDSISNLAEVKKLAKGRYYVTVTDANGCKATGDTIVTLYNPLVLNLSPEIIICTGNEFSITPVNGQDGNVVPNGTTYSWPKPEVSGVDGLAAGIDEERIHGIITNNTGSTVTIPYVVTPKNGVCVGTSSGLTVTVTATLNAGVILEMPNKMTKCSNSEDFALNVTFQHGINDFSTKWTMKEGTSSTETTVREFNNGLASAQSDSYTIDLDNDKCKTQYTYKVEYTDKVTGCKASDECVITVNSGTWSIGTPNGAQTVVCLSDAGVPSYPTNVTDSCGNRIDGVAVVGYPLDNPTEIGCTGTRTYKYLYTACDGTSKEWTYTYTIKDTVKPGFEITNTPAPEAIGNCKYTIPTVGYTTVTDCNFDKVTQDPPAGTEYSQKETEQVITITLTASDKCGKDSVLTTTVTIPAKPTVTIAAMSPICLGATVAPSLTVTPSTLTPTWSVTPSTYTVASSIYTPTAANTYTFTASVTDDNGCKVSDSKAVTVRDTLVPSLTTNSPVCLGSAVTVNETAGTTDYTYSVSYKNADGTATTGSDKNYSVTYTTAGTYDFVYTITNNTTNCVSHAKTTVTVNALPNVTLTGSTVCFGNTAKVTPEVSDDVTAFKWDAATEWIDVENLFPKSYTEVGNYTHTLTVKNANGCEATSNEATAVVNAISEVTVNGNNFCAGSSTELTVNTGTTTVYSYKWDDNSNKAPRTVSEGGTYKVTVTFVGGCQANGSITVKKNPLPVVTLSGVENVCYDSTKTYTATVTPVTGESYSYTWNGGTASTANTYTISNIQTDGTVTVTVTETALGTNCSTTKNLAYTVSDPLVSGNVLYDEIICGEDTVKYVRETTAASGGGGGVYLWQYSTDNKVTWNDIEGSNSQNYNIPPSYHTWYRRAYITDCGTVYTEPVQVTLSGTVQTGQISGTTAYCYGTEVNQTLQAGTISIESGAPYTLQWQSSTDGGNTWTDLGSAIPSTQTNKDYTYTNSSITQAIQFRYFIQLPDCAEPILCTGTINLTVNPQPTLTVTNKTQTGLEYGDNIQLIEITNTNSNLTVTPAGTYSHIQYNNDTKTITSSDYLTVGTYKFYVQAVSDQTPECNTLKDTVTVTVGPKTVTLVSGNASKMYDGSAITNADVAGKNDNGLVTETGWVGTDGATYTFTGTQTTVGSSPNAFSYTAKTGTDLNNYTINKTEGTLAITSNTSVLFVESKSKSWTYNGSAHTNYEYVVHFGDALINATAAGNGTYTATLGTGDVVTITPATSATITNVAETTVNNAFSWTVQNSGFYTNGTDIVGTLSIVCKEVTITANSNSKVYNGSALTESGFTASALETGDTHTFTVAMTSTSTITNVGTQPNVIATVDGVDVTGTQPVTVGNYCVTTVDGELEVTCKEVTLTANSNSKTYDGTPLTESGFTATALEPGDTHTFTVTMTPASTITYAGTTPNVIGTVDGVDVTGTQPVAVGNYCVTTVNGTLTINQKALIIELDSTKMYDGTKFRVTYDQLYTTGLVDGDYLASGNMWTESYQYNDTTYSGIHVGEYENNDGSFEAVEAIVGYVAKAGFSVKDAGGSVVTASYVPKFKVKLAITRRPITITAASDSKPYDGTDLTNSGHSITSGALATGDSYTATVTGAQLCKGTKNNVPSGAVITRVTEDVTADYTISYENGTLTVTDVDPGQFICPTAETFELNDCETSTSVTIAGTPTVTGVAAGHYTFVNNLTNPLSVGDHTITWKLLDDCGYEVGSCTQVVTVDYKPCTGVTWQGHPYDAVRIGSQCWFTENLQWNTGSAVAYGENAANVGKFGYLYTWYTAVGVPENDNTTAPTTQNDDCGNPYVQGICPPGWAVGNQADYDLLNTTAGSTSNLKDPSTEYWQAGYEGVTGGTGFNARGGGWYNSALSRYEDIMTGYHFWNSDSNPGTTVNSSTIVYYCDEILTVQAQKTDKMSVRCIRKKQ